MNYTIDSLRKQFPDDNACLGYIFQYRYGKTFPCPSCKKASWHRIAGRKAWACAFCGHHLYPLAGTIFHKSDTPLTLWFFALYKFANSRNGVAATELQRDLGVTYKTAWRIAKQIRGLMDITDLKLAGTVEVDSTYVGKRGSPQVIGLVQREGHVKAVAVKNVKSFNTLNTIGSEVQDGSHIMTDAAPVYRNLRGAGFSHASVNHSKKEYARGRTHINGVEGLFSQVKRSLAGTYHYVSQKHLQAYLDEFSWRLSHGRTGLPLFPVLLQKLVRR